MFYMCSGCASLTSLAFPALSGITVSRITTLDLHNMCSGCVSLETLTLPVLPYSNTTAFNMSNMCSGCVSLTSLTLPDHNNAENNNFMAYNVCEGCTKLETVHMEGFLPNTSSKISIGSMFIDCIALKEVRIGTGSLDGLTYNYSKRINMFEDIPIKNEDGSDHCFYVFADAKFMQSMQNSNMLTDDSYSLSGLSDYTVYQFTCQIVNNNASKYLKIYSPV